ncbi:tyrosine-type recombinase/integrase [Fusobacterium sp. PH5-44]|uniref:tyrosine-type recombinase/integrase n=1 Tax=unclassified Fusobacterium TaxID=2648384 RepID=UPI003D222669
MNLLWEYLENSLNNNTLDEKSFKQFEKDISEFNDFLEINEMSYEHITEEIIKDYAKILNEKYKYKPTYRKLLSIKEFYEYLLEKKMVEKNPLYDYVEVDETDKRSFINIEDYKKILTEINEDNEKESVYKIIIMLLYETSLKLTEILKLKKIDFMKYDFKSILIIKKSQMVPKSISQELSEKIKKYCYENSEENIFIKIKSAEFKEKLLEYGLRAKLSYNVTPIMVRNAKKINEQIELEKNEIDYLKKIKEVYMKIGIGDD